MNSIKRTITRSDIEVRELDGKKTITGYAAVFYRDNDPGTQYELWPGMVERIARSAFDRALREKQNARALFNHDPNYVLGTVASGTLALSVDPVGLRYEITPPDTAQAKDVIEMIRTGLINGSSFAFAEIGRMIEKGEPSVRTITDLDLYDISPVTYPAYEATSAALRAREIECLKEDMKEEEKPKDEGTSPAVVRTWADYYDWT